MLAKKWLWNVSQTICNNLQTSSLFTYEPTTHIQEILHLIHSLTDQEQEQQTHHIK